jgi:hypothetical protein
MGSCLNVVLTKVWTLAAIVSLMSALTTGDAHAVPTCPLSYGTTDASKSHKLYLYFPTADDNTFPNFGANTTPARTFDVANLDATIGTTAQLRDRIYDVVADDYCEFNVQVLQTTTNPATLASPPARRSTIAIGSDDPGGGWGLAQAVDIGDTINIDFARVWAGRYLTCEGGDGIGGCSPAGALTGTNSTLDRWAQAIGGTAAHEAGHTYGLSHSDDNPNVGMCGDLGPAPTPGEDAFNRHLMPAGCNLTGADRASYRRHVSNRGYGLLATNVGLSIQTMHNWDLVNPNAGAASSLAIDFLSALPAVTIAWSFTGTSSPWISPAVSGPSGTTVFKGVTLNRYRITWSIGNPAWSGGAPGLLPGGANFHIGATFTGVDFNAPDPIIIQNVTLFDAGGTALALHPRLPGYDSGAPDAADGTFAVNFFAAPGAAPLILQSAEIFQLPRVASIDSMIGNGRPYAFNKRPLRPWSRHKCERTTLGEKGARCVIAKMSDKPHVLQVYKLGDPNVYDCSRGVPKVNPPRTNPGDSEKIPDFDGPICAGSARDPFPSTTVYMIATFVDPKAKHYDRKTRKYVVGPVTSKVYYQFAGVRDLRKYAKSQGYELIDQPK